MVKTGSLKSSDMMQYCHVTGKTTEVLEGLLRSPVVESQSLAQKPGLRSGHWEAVICNMPPSSGHQDVCSSWQVLPHSSPHQSLLSLSSLCCFPSSFLCIQTFSTPVQHGWYNLLVLRWWGNRGSLGGTEQGAGKGARAKLSEP